MSGRVQEHGTVASYFVGFALSLACTLLPYYLVVNKLVSGRALLAMVLGFAMAQLLVQIIFFLHLGRGPKPNWNLFFFAATIAISLVVVGGSIFIINNLHYNMTPQDQSKRLVNNEGIHQVSGQKTGACEGQHENHQIRIMNGVVTPSHISATKCDTLTLINEDNYELEIAFGHYGHEHTYAGMTELVVRKGRGKTITLSESGDYKFHDHGRHHIKGSFSVNPE